MRWASLALAIVLMGATAASVTAVTTTDRERSLMTSINTARAERGLVALRIDSRLWDMAGDRAAVMAASNILSHTVAGSLTGSMVARHIAWFGIGETIAYTSATRGNAATTALFRMWRSSPPHWALLMSDSFNYLGVGMAYRAANGRTYGSVVLIEGPDRTGARAVTSSVVLTDGNDIRWTWTGYDPLLQRRTAGLRDFTVQERSDGGAWVTVATNTTAEDRSALNRARGHWYSLRVRSRDRAGNTGPWSVERRILVP